MSVLRGQVFLGVGMMMSGSSVSQASFQTLTHHLRDQLPRRTRQTLHPPGFRKSAVLVPLSVHDGKPALLYIVRADDSPTHAGQSAFPGGYLAPTDRDAVGCAIREAGEELAIAPSSVDILGLGDDALTPSQFVITPVYAALEPEISLAPNPREVASYFWAPIEVLRTIEKPRGTRTVAGIRAPMYGYLFGGHDIWGVTARMTKLLLDLTAEVK